MSTTAAAYTAGGGLLGVLVAQVVPRRKVRVDEFTAMTGELRRSIDDLQAVVLDKTHRIEALEREVKECEKGRSEDRAAFSVQIANLAVSLAQVHKAQFPES